MPEEVVVRAEAPEPAPTAPPVQIVNVPPQTAPPAANEDMGEIKALLTSMNAKLEAIATRPEPVAAVVEEPEPEPPAEVVAPPPPPPNPEPETPIEEDKPRSWLSKILHG